MFSYLQILVLMNLAAVLVTTIASIPIALVETALRRWTSAESEATSIKISLVFMALVYSALNATVTNVWIESQQIARSWPYGILGFVFTHLALNANLHSRRRSHRESWFSDPGAAAAVAGAGYGMLAGIIGYPVFYLYPGILRSIPRLEMFFAFVGVACAWLLGFWLVRVLSALAALWFILGAIQVYFTVAFMFGLFLVGLRRRPPVQVPEQVNQHDEPPIIDLQPQTSSPVLPAQPVTSTPVDDAAHEQDKGTFKVVDRRRSDR